MLEPTHLLALAEAHIARQFVRPAVVHAQQRRQPMQAQAGHQDGRHRHQRHRVGGGAHAGVHDGTLVAAEKLLHPLQGDRVDVPGVAAVVGDMVHLAVMRCMEAVVHAGREAQRGEHAVAVGCKRLRVGAKQVRQPVRKALGLEHVQPVDRAAGAQDGVAGAAQHLRVAVHHPGARLQFADEAVMHAVELGLAGFAQVQVAEQLPDPQRQIAHQWLADLAEPTHEAGEGDARNAIGQQEVQVLLLQDAVTPELQIHEDVKAIG